MVNVWRQHLIVGMLAVAMATGHVAEAVEHRFVARAPETDEPIWDAASEAIDLSVMSDEDVVLVLTNPTAEEHVFVMPQLEYVAHERIVRSVESMVPQDTVLEYTEPIRISVPPGGERRIRLSSHSPGARHLYSGTVVFFCALHKSSKAGQIAVSSR